MLLVTDGDSIVVLANSDVVLRRCCSYSALARWRCPGFVLSYYAGYGYEAQGIGDVL